MGTLPLRGPLRGSTPNFYNASQSYLLTIAICILSFHTWTQTAVFSGGLTGVSRGSESCHKEGLPRELSRILETSHVRRREKWDLLLAHPFITTLNFCKSDEETEA